MITTSKVCDGCGQALAAQSDQGPIELPDGSKIVFGGADFNEARVPLHWCNLECLTAWIEASRE